MSLTPETAKAVAECNDRHCDCEQAKAGRMQRLMIKLALISPAAYAIFMLVERIMHAFGACLGFH